MLTNEVDFLMNSVNLGYCILVDDNYSGRVKLNEVV